MGGLENPMKFEKQKAKSMLSVYLELSKLNILSLVLVATFLGYYLGNMGIGSWEKLLFTLLGTSLTAAGSGALNHYQEREPDSLMTRTKNRPLPAGLISPIHVLLYGVFMVISGSILLVWKVNLLTGFLSILNRISIYHCLYTIKKDYLVKYIYRINTGSIAHHWWLDSRNRGDRNNGLDLIWNYVFVAASSFLCNCLDVQGRL